MVITWLGEDDDAGMLVVVEVMIKTSGPFSGRT